MGENKRDFDKAAATWDENPARLALAQDVFTAISGKVSLTGNVHVLDFGCGTGLLTRQIAPLAASVTGADSSRGMLDALTAKAAAQGLDNVRTLLLDPDAGERLTGSYDVIVSNMTLHHIETIDALLEQFYACLTPGGRVCISDLDPDEGQFHGDSTGVFHPGFERQTLRRALEAAGFEDVSDTTAAEIMKPAANGEMRRFTVFLITGGRK